MTVPFDREAAAAFLDAMWGGHQGWAALAYGHDGYWDANGKYRHAKGDWRPQSYRWPNERARILDDIAARLASGRVDVYAAPLLRKHPKREKGNAAHYDLVWADADLVDLAAIEPLCPMVVNSGRDGHAHVYVRLAADVSPKEREALARGLMAHAGDCDPKIADNDVLRVPGTLNFKTDPPGRVTWHIPPGEHAKRWEASALAEALGVTLTPEELPLERPSRATVTPPREPRTVVTCFQKPRTPELSTALARNTGDRSADIAAVWGAASRAGWTVEEIVTLVIQERHPICDKWGPDGLLEDARRFYGKASEPYSIRERDRDRLDDFSDLIGGKAVGSGQSTTGSGGAGDGQGEQVRPGDEPDGDQETADEGEWWKSIAAKYEPLDWERLWAETPEEIEWLIEDLIERGQSIVIYSPPKTGKSLITLEGAAALATGRGVFGGEPCEPMRVLYVDIENSPRDIRDRLMAMGYGPADLGNLRYLSFPSLPALDSPEGGRDLRAVATAHGAGLVVIDTVSRVIAGSENDADTFAALYRYALAPLKGDGVSVIRLDHSGKDLTLGQRGSSAKSADVDSVWLLTKVSEKTLRLRREASRTGRGAEFIDLERQFEPLRHVRRGTGLVSAQVEELIRLLDELGVPADAGRTRAREVLAGAGKKASNDILTKVIKARKERANLSNRDESGNQDHRTGRGGGDDHEDGEPVREAVRRSSENRRSDLSGTVRGQDGQGARVEGLDLSAAGPSLKDGQPDRSVHHLFRTCTQNGCRNPVPSRSGDNGHPLCSECRKAAPA